MILKTLIPIFLLLIIVGLVLNFPKISKYFGFKEEEERMEN